MSISITDIKGTDSLSGSRIVINDNFSILADEINAIENYINPDAGTIVNLTSLKTDAIIVGLNDVILEINSSTFDIQADVDINDGDLSLNGGNLIRNNMNPVLIDDALAGGGTVEIGTSSAPTDYAIHRVNGDATGAIVVKLHDGYIGQEIIFAHTGTGSNGVEVSGFTTALVLPGAGSTPTVTLDEQGSAVHLLCVDDGTGNGEWFLIGGAGYTIS